MSAVAKLQDKFSGDLAGKSLKALSASGQLGYGLPEAALREGVERSPDFIGCDMGSVDPGPYYLGSGELATADAMTRHDLREVLNGARKLDVPLLLGTAGTAGAKPHLEKTLRIIREIAREDGLKFRLASITADMPKDAVKAAANAGRMQTLGTMPVPSDSDIDATTNLVGQMGTDAFRRALDAEADVIVAGRACDTAIFSSVPAMLGYPMGPAMHMAKIIECTSICCTPGGRDAMLGTLEGDSFTLESMNPVRHATPLSVAAHGLYEQADPFSVREPEGALHLNDVEYEAIDDHRVRARGARWEPATQLSVKLEGATYVGERGVLLAGACDPNFIAAIDDITPGVEKTVRELLAGTVSDDFTLTFRVYGRDGVSLWPTPPDSPPHEVFIMGECIAATAEETKTILTTCKQYFLHYGFPGRLSTAGNLAFPFTPPEVITGPAYRFSVYHVMETDDLESLFPVTIEEV
ncbi:MAG: acyclic terpene utilization AtuA family protein [Alphaproteobacteria bacterium]|nr:acyclic terpene utilization AtuA family protein [Alphaproteobacteria bacterium]